MKGIVIALAVLLLAALVGLVVMTVQSNEQQTAVGEAQELLQQSEISTEAAKEAAKQAEAQLKQARAEATAAKEAERMAKLAAEEQETARKALVKELNERLATEEAARQAADEAAKEAAAKMEELEKTLEEAEVRQKEIAERVSLQTEQAQKKHQDILLEIQRRRTELQALSERQNAAQRQRERAIEQQIVLEEKIQAAGGTITIPNYRVWSPNYRPRYNRPNPESSK